ncbi:cell envelope-related transcriptional attenuator [Alkaliphilus metalliredigens QYMF]|uniref:Cell envelope-related transcriptional attenuator n=1 Tax=Alkaliphilus metalliredigens (strain QYMF) TaxID=293826 RepID=A6TM28_ALKMQ|nr:LCP family protein [Alkaliphilus metalliredigens]ABR47246.1 cell envelope-related transcriptional attenuator [Alkaliphilus metalliredigens QYMF]
MKKWQWAVVVSLCSIIVVTMIYGYSIYRGYKNTLNHISVISENVDIEQGEEFYNQDELESFVMLIYGISARKQLGDMGRSDTMMLALVDPNEMEISLISIPRDAYVQIPGYRMDKINGAYPRGGSELMMKTIEEWLDIQVNSFASINFQGFVDLVDLVNGIKVEVSRKMEYDDPADGTRIRLYPGEQVLDGKNALDFVRFRQSNDGRHASDYDRMLRQQEALQALAGKKTSVRTLTRAFDMMNILSENVQTSLTPGELEKLIRIFLSFKPEDLQTTSIQGEGYYHNGGWYERVPQTEVERIQEIIRGFLSIN